MFFVKTAFFSLYDHCNVLTKIRQELYRNKTVEKLYKNKTVKELYKNKTVEEVVIKIKLFENTGQGLQRQTIKVKPKPSLWHKYEV